MGRNEVRRAKLHASHLEILHQKIPPGFEKVSENVVG